MAERNSVPGSVASTTRRTVLRTAGAAVPAAVGLTRGTARVAAADYRTVEVDAGEREVVSVSGDETFENVRLDVTADGASVFFDVKGSGWTVRNVAVEGVNESDDPLVHASVSDPDGEGRFENVYFGDGTTDGDGVGVWVDATGSDAHVGALVFDRVHVAGFADNGIYASGPGYQLGPSDGGPVHVRNSLARNNNISQIRLGTDGSTVENSLALVDGEVPAHGDVVNPRGVWLREGAREVAVEGSTTAVRSDEGPLAVAANELEQGTVRDSVVDGRVRGEDNLDFEGVRREAKTIAPPDGVPMSPDDAVGR